MVETLMLPLRPSYVKHDGSDLLRAKILQINEQIGSFRNVNEHSLLEEIATKPSTEDDVDMDDSSDEEEEDSEDKIKTLYKGREEILRQVNIARNEAYSALDFISLLLTKYNSRMAETSMSPFLKQQVPLATLEAQHTKNTGPSAIEKKNIELVSNGWKLESFSASAERLLRATSRLEKEADHESKYWQQLSQLESKGWLISRLPNERHTLAVRFGCSEAAPTFRNRGVAALRSREDGGLYLDIGVPASKPHAVQVSVWDDGHQVCASSILKNTSAEPASIEQEVLQARDSLFEEELFHEANREARTLAAFGVMTGHKFISFTVGATREVHIRLVEMIADGSILQSNQSSDIAAEAMALSLRMLLSRAHKQNLERRTRPPLPMTIVPRQVPEYRLLRPVIAHLQHRHFTKQLTTWVEAQTKSLQAAGLTVSVDASTMNQLNSASLSQALYDQSLESSMVETLLAPLESIVTVHLPSSRSLKVKIRSYLEAPIFGTDYIMSEINWESFHLPEARYTTLDECENSTAQILMQDTMSTIEAVSVTGPDPSALNKDVPHISWKSERPFSGTFIAWSGTSISRSHLEVQLTASATLLRYAFLDLAGKPTKATIAWMKDGQAKKEVNGRPVDAEGILLLDVLKDSLQQLAPF